MIHPYLDIIRTIQTICDFGDHALTMSLISLTSIKVITLVLYVNDNLLNILQVYYTPMTRLKVVKNYV